MAGDEAQTIVFPREVNDLDALHYFLGEREECNVAMTMVAILEHEIPFSEVRRTFAGVAEEMPRSTEYLRPMPAEVAPPIWWPEDSYRVEDHCTEIQLDPDADWDDVVRLVDEVQSSPWRDGSAPMNVYYVRGAPGGRTVLLLKMHHAMADGVTLTLFFGKVFLADLAQASGVTTEMQPRPERVLADAVGRGRRRSLAAVSGVAGRAAQVLTNPGLWRRELESWRGYVAPAARWPVGAHSSSRHSALFSAGVEEWREAARRRGGGVNELYLAIAAVAARRHFGERLDSETLRVVMPVDTREASAEQDGGSVLSVGVLSLAGTEEELEALQPIREASLAAQREASEREAGAVEQVVGALPGPLRARLTFNRFAKEDIVATNLVVPVKGALHGAAIEELYMMAPAVGTPLSFSLATYEERVYLVLNMDAGLVDDPDGMAASLQGVLHDVLGEAAVTALRRPGSAALSGS